MVNMWFDWLLFVSVLVISSVFACSLFHWFWLFSDAVLGLGVWLRVGGWK